MDDLLRDLGQVKVITSLAVLVILLAWESYAPVFTFFRNATRERAKHGAKNLLLGVINATMTALLFVGLWLAAAQWAEAHRFGLLNWLNLPPWPHAAGAIILIDAWMYVWHWLNHRIPFFWRFHRTHHSDPKMDVTTANRFHFGEIIFSSFLRVPLILLVGNQLWELLLYETVMFVVVQLHHANIGLPPWLDRLLRIAIVTPAMHKVHHSRWQIETDSNFASLFSVWDRLFRTFRLRADPGSIRVGLDALDQPEWQTLVGLVKTPFPKTSEEEQRKTGNHRNRRD